MSSFQNQPEQPSRFEGVCILLIEDNPDHMYLIKAALEVHMPGIETVGVTDRPSVEAMLLSDKNSPMTVSPRLILLDLYLPTRAEGLLVLQTLRDHFLNFNLPPIPIVVFSYSDSREDIQLSYRHGANAYLIKSADSLEWGGYFSEVREFWLETASLPTRRIF